MIELRCKRIQEAIKRGRMFEAAVMRLAQWWYENFKVLDWGHIQSRTYEQVETILKNDGVDWEEGEFIKSEKSLMKRAIERKGSRDTSAQLFTALCRALDIPARLVVSLQSVPWQAKVGKDHSGSKRASKAASVAQSRVDSAGESDDYEMVPVDIDSPSKEASSSKHTLGPSSVNSPASSVDKGKSKAPESKPERVIKLRKQRPSGQKLGSKTSSHSARSCRLIDFVH